MLQRTKYLQFVPQRLSNPSLHKLCIASVQAFVILLGSHVQIDNMMLNK